MKDFYKEIDEALKTYEEGKSWHHHDMAWITDKIDWCNKWKKLPEEQVNELCDRAISLFEEGRC